MNFNQISRCTVHFEKCDYESQTFQFETLKINVNSLRLDKITACLIRKSREKTQDFIKSSMVNINYKTVEDCAFLCHNYDILSLRGYGRFRIDEIQLNNRSGNYIVTVKKYV